MSATTGEPLETTPSFEALRQVIEARRSIREYDLTRPVTRLVLQSIVEAARLAPSAGNLQAYTVHILEKREEGWPLCKHTW